jgi:hypothetical protein
MAANGTALRKSVEFNANVPMEVALQFPHGKTISTRNGERMMFTLADNRVMFLDLAVAQKIEELGVNVRETFFICKYSAGGRGKKAEWNVWLSPETEKARAAAEAGRKAEAEAPKPEEESQLELQLRQSIELARQGKLGEVGNGTFIVSAGASAGTPAPGAADASNGHHTNHNGNGSTHGSDGNALKSKPTAQTAWVQSLLTHANQLVDVYAAALSNASTKHGNQVKPEDVRSLLVTVFIQRSRGGSHGV